MSSDYYLSSDVNLSAPREHGHVSSFSENVCLSKRNLVVSNRDLLLGSSVEDFWFKNNAWVVIFESRKEKTLK